MPRTAQMIAQLIAVLIAALYTGAPVAAAVMPGDVEQDAALIAPPDVNAATEVSIGLFVVDITDVNELADTFSAEAYLVIQWDD